MKFSHTLFGHGWGVVALSALALLPLAAVQAQSDRVPGDDGRPPVPILRVNGEAEVGAEPDMATFTVGAEIRDPSASKTMTELTRITDGLTAALKAQGIPQDKIETIQLSLNDVQEPEQPGPTTEKTTYRRVYMGTHILQVEIGKGKFKQIGEMLDASIKAGANQVGNITFGVKDEEAMRSEGLRKAVENAAQKASVMAKAAGVPIKGVLTLSEGGYPGPRPMYEATARAFSASAGPQPVTPGQIKRTYSVTVEYRLGS